MLGGLERGQKWCSAARRPHADLWRRIWERYRNIGEEARIDSVTNRSVRRTCPKQSRPSWMKQAASPPQATNGQMSWPKRELVMTPSILSCTTRTRQLSNQAEPSSATLGFILRAKGGARWPHVVAPPQGWDEKGASSQAEAQWKAMTLRGVWQARKRWCSEGKTGTHSMHGASRNDAGGSRQFPQCHLLTPTGSFVWCCRCGARAAKFAKKIGEPCVEQSRSQEHARSIRLPSSGWHPKEHRFFLDRRSCPQRKHGGSGGKATKGTTATELRAQASSGSASLGRSAADGPR